MKNLKTNPQDISTYSNFDEVIQREMELDVSIDFDRKEMIGTVKATYEILKKRLDKIILDLHGPRINSVNLLTEDLDEIPLSYEIYEKNIDKDALGTPLIIYLDDLKQNNEEEYQQIMQQKSLTISIGFVTTEKCNGIQYLTKDQTHTKKYPFMFTQCEAIQCRTLFPVQDTPSVKAKYKVKTSIDMPLFFLFSGLIKSHYYDSQSKKKVMIFEQNIPIPSYLVAFVAGELEYGKISKRCGVWTEKGLVQMACNEFVDAEKYIEIAENYLGHPYEWKIYNILVLPFSFPFGGMENPNLTFVTPALLAGDRSMSNVIGHEICHSWTGNLVTNKNWKNFWVNEGFTKFLERKLDEELLGKDMSELESIVGHNSMLAAIKLYGEDSNFTCLSPNYEGIDPDDGFSTIPYEKGCQFLKYLESEVGEEIFREIMRRYIDKYQYESVDYTAFKEVFEDVVNEKFNRRNSRKLLSSIDWNKWLTEKGTPSYTQEYKSKYTDEINKMVKDILSKNENPEEVAQVFNGWHTNVKLVFLDEIKKRKDDIDKATILRIKDELSLAEGYNDDIKASWYDIALAYGIKEEIPNLKNFLQTHGRLKYVKPLYAAWMNLNFQNARKFFNENKYLYHPIARRIIQDKFDNAQK